MKFQAIDLSSSVARFEIVLDANRYISAEKRKNPRPNQMKIDPFSDSMFGPFSPFKGPQVSGSSGVQRGIFDSNSDPKMMHAIEIRFRREFQVSPVDENSQPRPLGQEEWQVRKKTGREKLFFVTLPKHKSLVRGGEGSGNKSPNPESSTCRVLKSGNLGRILMFIEEGYGGRDFTWRARMRVPRTIAGD